MPKTRTIYRHWIIRALLYPLLFLAFLYTMHFAADLLIPVETTPADRERAAAYLATHNLPTPPEPFHRDGCTLFPDRLPGHDFTEACLQHDIAYWAGGDRERKRAVNHAFRADIRETGPLGPGLSVVMYIGVTWFGDNGISRVIDSHWGYGWD